MNLFPSHTARVSRLRRAWKLIKDTLGLNIAAPSGTETAMRIRVNFSRRGFLA